MYKSRLQELCQRRHWELPQYTASRDGPDHSPLFRATVTVNGAAFHSPDDSCSSKQAQDRAAQVAFEQLSAEDPPTAPSWPLPVALDSQVSYKNQLQIYLQKKNKGLPSYFSVHDGSPIRHFKAIVKIDGQSFESTGYFHTIKEAEQSAAMVALMSLFPKGNEQASNSLFLDDAVYKNLLQELMQKHGFPLPKYTTISYGESHIPSFSSTVEIKGEFFKGDVAKTKKQAEMNAAKVAWSHLKEEISSRFPSDLLAKWQVLVASEPVISRSDTITNLKHLKPSVDAHKMDDIISDGHGEASGLTVSPPCDQIINSAKEAMNTDGSFRHSASYTDEHNPEITINKKDTVSLVHKPEAVDVMKNGKTLQGAMSDDGSSALSSNSNGSNIHAKTATEPPIGRNTVLLCNRVRIYPNKSDLVLPEDAIPLPCSDDSWVAVSFDL
ncbi:unnamed protein product [Musa acuminata subsp. malaccensis]|uniref:(wild Malaysian banana) hypothetical protein n=1 Tax=Musa acuminata subsp. malaccensis TaxID=214687 RepID=A0A8D7A9Q1_MUSAM|nr:unnamed protein product [Musa acuminata subsp. malaccensis]